MLWKKKYILVILIVIFLLIPTITWSTNNFLKKENVLFNMEMFEYSISEDDIRTQHKVFFNISYPQEEYNYTWSFGDGNISHGISVSHIYKTSNYFNITLEISVKNKCKNSTKEIEVKLFDMWGIVSDGVKRNINPFSSSGSGISWELNQATTFPKITISGTIEGAIGKLGIIIRLYRFTNNGMEEIELDNTIAYHTFNTIKYHNTFSSLNSYNWNRPYSIGAMVVLENGRYESWTFEMLIEY
jgi:hypothetical protein